MSGGNNMNFSYDGTERRVYKKDVVNSVTTEILYLHDGMNAIVERSKTSTPTEYIYGPTGIIAVKTPSSMFYVLKDHLGSTRVVINTTEPPYALTTYDYSAFGTILSTQTSSAYLYTGQEWDQTSGLHNFKARMYDSDLAMFYGADPAGQYSSPFSYVGNNPVVRIDPSGTFSFKWDWKQLIPGYNLYSLGRNVVNAYNNAGGGLHGVLEGFAVTNQWIIATGTEITVAAATGGPNAIVASQVAKALPRANVPLGKNVDLNISPTVALGMGEGAAFGLNASVSSKYGGLDIAGSYGNGSMIDGLDGFHGKIAPYGQIGRVSIARTTFFGGTDNTFNQSLYAVRYQGKHFSFAWSNDWPLGLPIPSATDKGRTAAVEFGWDNYIIGTQIYTSDRLGEVKPREPGGFAYYSGSQAYYSPLYVGYRRGENVYRIGLESQLFQVAFQNYLIHSWQGIPLFNERSGSWAPRPYYYHGTYKRFIY